MSDNYSLNNIQNYRLDREESDKPLLAENRQALQDQLQTLIGQVAKTAVFSTAASRLNILAPGQNQNVGLHILDDKVEVTNKRTHEVHVITAKVATTATDAQAAEFNQLTRQIVAIGERIWAQNNTQRQGDERVPLASRVRLLPTTPPILPSGPSTTEASTGSEEPGVATGRTTQHTTRRSGEPGTARRPAQVHTESGAPSSQRAPAAQRRIGNEEVAGLAGTAAVFAGLGLHSRMRQPIAPTHPLGEAPVQSGTVPNNTSIPLRFAHQQARTPSRERSAVTNGTPFDRVASQPLMLSDRPHSERRLPYDIHGRIPEYILGSQPSRQRMLQEGVSLLPSVDTLPLGNGQLQTTPLGQRALDLIRRGGSAQRALALATTPRAAEESALEEVVRVRSTYGEFAQLWRENAPQLIQNPTLPPPQFNRSGYSRQDLRRFADWIQHAYEQQHQQHLRIELVDDARQLPSQRGNSEALPAPQRHGGVDTSNRFLTDASTAPSVLPPSDETTDFSDAFRFIREGSAPVLPFTPDYEDRSRALTTLPDERGALDVDQRAQQALITTAQDFERGALNQRALPSPFSQRDNEGTYTRHSHQFSTALASAAAIYCLARASLPQTWRDQMDPVMRVVSPSGRQVGGVMLLGNQPPSLREEFEPVRSEDAEAIVEEEQRAARAREAEERVARNAQNQMTHAQRAERRAQRRAIRAQGKQIRLSNGTRTWHARNSQSLRNRK